MLMYMAIDVYVGRFMLNVLHCTLPYMPKASRVQQRTDCTASRGIRRAALSQVDFFSLFAALAVKEKGSGQVCTTWIVHELTTTTFVWPLIGTMTTESLEWSVKNSLSDGRLFCFVVVFEKKMEPTLLQQPQQQPSQNRARRKVAKMVLVMPNRYLPTPDRASWLRDLCGNSFLLCVQFVPLSFSYPTVVRPALRRLFSSDARLLLVVLLRPQFTRELQHVHARVKGW